MLKSNLKSTCTRSWRIYGADGHRQRESFSPSYVYDFTRGEDVRIIEILNADKTGTNDYTIIRITRNTSGQCADELDGQLSDGIFENSRTGKVEEIKGDEPMTKTERKVIELYKNYGCLAAEKRAIYTYGGQAGTAVCSDVVTVELPAGWDFYENVYGAGYVTTPDGNTHAINSILSGDEYPAFRIYDGYQLKQYRLKIVEEE